jgi:micrococcal nuclease
MYEYQATVLRVIDGDTVELMIDLGLKGFRKEIVRLYGINTPEIHTVKGKLVKHIVQKKLPTGCKIKIKTYKDKQGKYGRWLVDVIVNRLNLNKYLLRYGWAVPYT